MCNGWVYEVEPEGEISPEQDELGQPTGIASCQRAGFSPMLKHEEPLMVIASIVYLVAAGFGISRSCHTPSNISVPTALSTFQ